MGVVFRATLTVMERLPLVIIIPHPHWLRAMFRLKPSNIQKRLTPTLAHSAHCGTNATEDPSTAWNRAEGSTEEPLSPAASPPGPSVSWCFSCPF